MYTRFMWGNLGERDHLEDQGVDKRTLIRCVFSNWDVGAWARLVWFGRGTVGGHL